MVFEFKLPDIGEGIHEGEIVSWLVDEGDQVEENQDICEVMTDKATVEISSPRTGTIQTIHFQEGEVVHVGDVFVTIAVEGEAAEGAGPSTTETAETAEGTGAATAKPGTAGGAEVAEVAEDVGSEVEAADGPGAAPPAHASSLEVPATNVPPANPGYVAPPSVRRAARARGLDLSTVAGSGPAGRVTMADLASTTTASQAPPADARPRAAPTPGGAITVEIAESPAIAGGVERIRLDAARAADARRAKHFQPHFTYQEEVRADRLLRLVDEAQAHARDAGFELSPLHVIVKAVATALRRHPDVNVCIDETSDETVAYEDANIAVSVRGPNGARHPVVRAANRRSLLDVAKAVSDAAGDAAAGRLDASAEAGASFTVHDQMHEHSLGAMLVLRHPQVAAMSVQGVRDVVVLDDAGRPVPAKGVVLSFAFDHRVVDGYEGAQFAQTVCRFVEDPKRLLLEGL